MTDPRRVAQADVLVAGRPAATLTRTDAGVAFAYRPDYLDAPGPPVATTLPLTEEPVLTPAGAVPPFFAGLLPEGRRLTNLRRTVKTSADDDLSLLIAVGADPVGDVQVFPAGATNAAESEVAPTSSPIVTGDWADLDFTDLLADSGIVDPVALAGVQDKVSGRMLTVPLAHAGRAQLLKLDPPEYPGVVRDEAFFLQVARRLRQQVVDAELVHDRHGRPGLLVRRFDRVADGMDGMDGADSVGLRRLAVEDAAQLLRRYPADKYAVTTEQLIDAVGAVCAARPVAIRAVLQQVALAWLTGNGDLHAKNVSVVADRTGSSVEGGSGEWRVSPIYDIPSTLPYGDPDMALSVQGRTDSLSRKRYLALADRAGLPARAAERALEDVLRATTGVAEEAIEALELDPGRARTLRRVLTRRHEGLCA